MDAVALANGTDYGLGSAIFQNLTMEGKAAVVTGAASDLGRETALKLTKAGAKLWLVDVNAAALAETVELLAPNGCEVCTETADLADPAACKAVIAHAVEKFGRLDALYNVAGLIYLANSHQMPLEQYQRTINVSLNAPFILSQTAIPHLLETKGAIVNVASSASYIGEAYAAAYCASSRASTV